MDHRANAPAAGCVVVLGSANVDYSAYVDALPAPGETVLARGGAVGLGGKGANQAVAASLAGADVHLIGRVGRDSAATLVRERLRSFGVSAEHLAESDAATGAAYITVDAAGENTITVVSGANADPDAAGLAATLGRIVRDAASPAPGGTVVGLAQGERPAALVQAFARLCERHDVRFVLNLAPVIPLDDDTIRLSDPLVVNEVEAQALMIARVAGTASVAAAGDPADAASVVTVDQARDVARRLVAEGAARSVVITLGAAGAVAADGDGRVWHQPSPRVGPVVDTTGAGDAFVGVLCARLAGSADLADAVRWAVAAGSAATTRPGTTASYPDQETLAGIAAGVRHEHHEEHEEVERV